MQARLKKHGITSSDKILVVIPTAGYWTKMWKNSDWALVIDSLLKKKNTKIILLGAPREKEFGMIRDLVTGDIKRVFNWIGELPILESAALVKHADLLISPDNGIMHLAAAVGTKTVSLFGPTDPQRWGPHTNKPDHHRIIYKQWSCSPCGRINSCPYKRECMNTITSEDVLEALP